MRTRERQVLKESQGRKLAALLQMKMLESLWLRPWENLGISTCKLLVVHFYLRHRCGSRPSFETLSYCWRFAALYCLGCGLHRLMGIE
jgi:hypothetical protein